MIKIRPEDIHYSYNTRGYMMYYKEKPIGGAGISKEAKGCRSNLKLFQNCADIDKRGILAGRETRYINEIRRIEREAGKTKEEVKNRLLSGETLGDMFQITDGQECEIFKAKSFVNDGSVVYIPDLHLNEIYEYVDHAVQTESEEETDEIIEDIISCCYTAADFLEIAGGDWKKAEILFEYCDWQHPSSALPEIEEEDAE